MLKISAFESSYVSSTECRYKKLRSSYHTFLQEHRFESMALFRYLRKYVFNLSWILKYICKKKYVRTTVHNSNLSTYGTILLLFHARTFYVNFLPPTYLVFNSASFETYLQVLLCFFLHTY